MTKKGGVKGIQYLKLLDRPEDRESFAPDFISRIQGSHPKMALEALELLPEGSVRNKLIPRFAAAWARKDLSSAQEWVTRIENDEVRMDALQNIRQLNSSRH